MKRSWCKVLSRGYVEGSSENIVDSKLKPHLKLLLSSGNSQVQQFGKVIQDLLDRVDQLKHRELRGVGNSRLGMFTQSPF
ncbi:MAG: hypothetical protein M1816_001974 [Peltula sp. TS41687]|nr:MAG: hypothetical protein M1816_001974 [Peltula sp. TS41687]